MLAKTVYLLVFSLSSLTCLSIAARVKQMNKTQTSNTLFIVLCLSGLWSLATVAQISLQNKFLIEMSFTVGIIIGFATAITWVYFSLEFAGFTYQRKEPVKYVAVFVFTTVALINITNPIHQMYFITEFGREPFLHLIPKRRLLNNTILFLSYLMPGVGIYIVYSELKQNAYDSTSIQFLAVLFSTPAIAEIISTQTSYILPLSYQPVGLALASLGSVILFKGGILEAKGAGVMQLFDSIEKPGIVVQDDTVIVINSAAESICSKSINPPVDVSELPDNFEKIVRSDSDDKISINAGNKTKTYTVLKTPVNLGQYEVGYSYLLTDITEIVEKKNALKYQRNQLGHVATSVRHYLRNQTSIVRGYIDNTEHYGDLCPEAEESLSKAQEANDEVIRIIEKLSTIANVSKLADNVEDVNIKNIVHKTDSNINHILTVDDKTVTANRRLFKTLVEHYIEYLKSTGAKNANIQVYDNRIEFKDDGDYLSHDTVAAAFDHGEITGEGIQLNVIRAVITSHKWRAEVQVNSNTRKIIVHMDENPEK